MNKNVVRHTQTNPMSAFRPFRLMLWLLFSVLLSGCAATRSPNITSGRYLNERYQFSLEIPPGWTPLNNLPLSFRPPSRDYIQPPSAPPPSLVPGAIVTAPTLSQMTVEWKFSPTLFRALLLFNNDAKGAIVVKAERIGADYSKLSPDQVANLLSAALREEARHSKLSNFIVDDTYKVFPAPVSATPVLAALVRLREVERRGIKASGILPLQHEYRMFLYTLNGGSTCRVTLWLMSDEQTFAENYRAFDTFVSTLKRLHETEAPRAR